MHFFERMSLLLVLIVAAVGLSAMPAEAQPEVITSLSCLEEDLGAGDVVILEHDVTCETLWWFAEGVKIDLNGHTVTATNDHYYCGWEDLSECDIDLSYGGELKNGHLVGADVNYGTVRDVEFDGSTVVDIEGDGNYFRNSIVAEGIHHQNSVFVDSHLQHVTQFDHNLLVRSNVWANNWTGFHGIHFDIHHNWMVDSSISGSVELNAPGDVQGTIHHNLILDGSVGISGVLGPTMGSMSITDNTIVRGGIQVATDPPEFGVGGPLSVARNTIWFSPSSISINSPFVLGDLTGNKAIFSGRCVGVTCRPW